MLYLYFDESGDLGFDFVSKKSSKYFVVTILMIVGRTANKQVIKSVKKTLSRKLNSKKNRNRIVLELKGSKTSLDVKKYFYDLVESINFKIFSVIVDKSKVSQKHFGNTERLYNYVAHQALDKIPFEDLSVNSIDLVADKRKGKVGMKEFNDYIRAQLEARIDPKIPLNILHHDSQKRYGLQACDMLCWGFTQKYAKKNIDWYDVFKEKITIENVYVP